MSEEQEHRSDSHATKRTPSKAGGVLSLLEVYPGSGSKRLSRQLLRTPQQHVPLKVDDRMKNRRASKSFVLMDQSDKDTPRAHIEAFMGVAQTAQKTQSVIHTSSATKKKKSRQALTLEDTRGSMVKAPRVRELAAAGSVSKSRVSSPGSKSTPRSNIWNLLQTGDEKTPVMRTVNLSETRSSPGLQNLTAVKNAGQRVSVSPIDVSSVGTESRRFGSQSSASRRAKRRSFHLNSSQPDSFQHLSSVQHSGQRVSVSPINVSDNRVESTDFSRPKSKKSRRSFHFTAPQSEEMLQQNEDLQVDSGEGGTSNYEGDTDGMMSDSSGHENLKEGINPFDVSGRKDIPLARRQADEVTGTLELGVEHTSLVIGEKTATQTLRTGLTDNITDVVPTDHSLSLHRKSSISKHVVSIEHGVSAVEPLDLSEAELRNGNTPGIMQEQAVDSSDKNTSAVLNDDQVRVERSKSGSVSDKEENQRDKSVERDQILRDDMEEEGGPWEGSQNLDNVNSRALDNFRSNRQEKVVDNVGVRPEQDGSNEGPAIGTVDPASVYDLSEGSSVSREDNSMSTRNKSRDSSSIQKLSSKRRKTPGNRVNNGSTTPAPSDEHPESSKRKRLEFSDYQPTGAQAVGSPDLIEAVHDLPRSSTPINRSRKFFNSTKIQRSVTDYFQGDEDPVSAITPKTRNLFSDISPIRAPAGERAGTESDNAADEPFSRQASTSKKMSGINEEDVAISQSSDGEMPSFSSLATPHIDLRKRVIMSSLQRKPQSVSRSKSQKIQHQIPKANKTKNAAKQTAKASVKNLPRKTVKYFAELHSDMKLSKDAIDEIERVSEQFWVDTFKALEAYALHAGRKSVQDADVILLMKTQRLISGTEDLHNKIRQLMPMELRKELIPCAYRTLNHK